MKKIIQKHYVSMVFGATFFIGFLYGIFCNNYQIDALAYLLAASMAVILFCDKENRDSVEDKQMPKCCYDCKNLDWDYEYDGIDETIFFYCKRGKSREFVDDLSICECDKHNPYKEKREIPHKVDRKFHFEIDD